MNGTDADEAAGGHGPAAHLDALPEEEAARALRRCCASERWVRRMLARRPFGEDARLFEAAEEVWWSLGPEDWREAFAAHPRIGERVPSGAQDAEAEAWSREEQAGVEGSADATRRALAEGNRAYEERFGHVFLIYASGKSGEEMLAALRERLENDPEEELRIAAGEQAKITRDRLEKLTEGTEGP